MAFWKKRGEDPWDMDPNRKRELTLFYERDPEPADADTKQVTSEPEAEQERPEEAPDCPWCGESMMRAYLVGGREPVYLSDQKPTRFLGSFGYDVQDLSDVGFFTTHTSCWQCKRCRKVVVDIPEPEPESRDSWDGNPVAPYTPKEQEDDNHDL